MQSFINQTMYLSICGYVFEDEIMVAGYLSSGNEGLEEECERQVIRFLVGTPRGRASETIILMKM